MADAYEEIRRRLVERGYLHGPIERFLLRDLVSGARPPRLTRTSLKAALLGAPLLGGLLAASTVAANRPWLTARDALVVWLYCALLAGAALFFLDLFAAVVAAAWARRRGAGRVDAARAGLFVAVPLLAYLVVAWAEGRHRQVLAADLLFLVGALAATALVAWLAGLVSLAGIVGRTGEVPDRRRRPVALIVAVLLPVAAGFFLLPSAAGGAAGASPGSPVPGPPSTSRLIVAGVDGLDGALVEASADAGTGVNLLDLLARGAVFPRRRPAGEPPEIWTTLVTGMPVEAHGVRTVGASRLPGVATPIAAQAGPAALEAALRFLFLARTVPASGAARRVKTLWEMSGSVRPAAAVGWWASWPARGTQGDPTTGYTVSDRVLAKLLSSGGEDRDTRPEALFERLREDFGATRQALRSEFDARFGGLPAEERGLAWESCLIDGFAWRTLRLLVDDPQVASAYVYLPGLDILRTRLASRATSARTVLLYVGWLDAGVFADLGALARDTRALLVADPGRSAGPSPEGFVAAIGGGAAAACVGPTIGDLDVAPLALRLMDLPASRDMPGRAPRACFEGAGAEPAPIATWGRRGRPSVPARSAYDPEMVERLKSLGYLR